MSLCLVFMGKYFVLVLIVCGIINLGLFWVGWNWVCFLFLREVFKFGVRLFLSFLVVGYEVYMYVRKLLYTLVYVVWLVFLGFVYSEKSGILFLYLDLRVIWREDYRRKIEFLVLVSIYWVFCFWLFYIYV